GAAGAAGAPPVRTSEGVWSVGAAADTARPAGEVGGPLRSTTGRLASGRVLGRPVAESPGRGGCMVIASSAGTGGSDEVGLRGAAKAAIDCWTVPSCAASNSSRSICDAQSTPAALGASTAAATSAWYFRAAGRIIVLAIMAVNRASTLTVLT